MAVQLFTSFFALAILPRSTDALVGGARLRSLRGLKQSIRSRVKTAEMLQLHSQHADGICDSDGDQWHDQGDNNWHTCASNSACSTSDPSAGCTCNSGYTCLSDCDHTFHPECEQCVDPVLTKLEISNVQYTSEGVDDVETYCNNTGGASDSSLTCIASFDLTETYSQTGTLSGSLSAAITGKVSVGEDVLVEEASYSVSATLSGEIGMSEAVTTSESLSLSSSCKVTLNTETCESLTSSTSYGKMTADYSATATCESGYVANVSGTFTFDGVTSTAEISDCSTSTIACSD